ncbi:MAG: PPC domain-containing protein [Bacteroidales bacterium]|nr:PPC domain-containing protein [Bacteroidales bacterium]
MKRVLIILAVLAICLPAAAQKGNIGYVYPAGAKRGTTVEVTVGGQNISKAKSVVISGKGVSGEILAASEQPKRKGRKKKDIGEEDNLQLADRVKFRISIAKDAELGLRDLRLVLPNGMSNRLYFEVGELPDVLENPKEALSGSSSSLPVTFNGQIMRSDVDRFRFSAVKGRQLVLQVKGRIFVPYMADAVPGWFQPIIRLYGPDGKEIAYNDDYRWNVDPVLFFKVPESGNYEVEINDALYRGREDFVYRIDVGELPFITSVSPLGGPSGRKNEIKLTGYNLKSEKMKLKCSKEGKIGVVAQGPGGLHSNRMWFYSDIRNQLNTKKMEPNTEMAAAWELSSGEVCENVISKPLEQHWYSVEVENRKPVHFEVMARRLGAPTDVKMTLFDSYMNVVKDVDDTEDPDESLMTHFADPELTMKLQPGKYYVRIVEAQAHGGPEYAYRFSWAPAQPDFSLFIEPATISVPEQGSAVFTVQMNPKQNFRGAVDISVSGLPHGFKVAGNRIEQFKKKTFVSITAPEGAEKGTIMPKVTGTAEMNNTSVTRDAVPAESMMQAFYYTHLMPMEEFRVEVGEKTPFRIKVVRDGRGPLHIERGGTFPVKVVLERDPGFNSPVTLMMKSTDGFIKAEAVVVPEGECEGVLELKVREVVKSKRTVYPRISVYGVVKGSSKKIAGKGRNAYVASVTAYAPVFIAELDGLKQ